MDDEKNEDIETSENNDENANSENSEDLETIKKEKEDLESKNKQLYERTKKAEAEAKELREKETKSDEIIDKTSNEPDYAKLAFLKGENVTHPDDQKIVQDEADRLKLPLTDVLQMEHIKSQLKEKKDERDVKENTPTGNRKGSSKSQQDVDYWVDKKDKDGVYQTPDDLDLAEKVINTRMKKQEESNKFDPIR